MAQRAARGQNRTSPICNWTRLNSPPTRSDSGVFSLEVRDTALVNGVTKLTSPAATSDHQRASLEWDENSWPPYCSVRAVKDAFRQDIKSGSVQRNLAPMFDQRPNRQQNHTFLGWEKAARAHATAASGTGYSILHEDRGEARKRWRNRCAHRALVFRTSAFSVNVRFAPEAANQEWHWVRSWRIFSSLPLSPLSSKPLGKSCWRRRKEPIGGT